MRIDRSFAHPACSPGLYALGVVLLLGLSACGASGQPAAPAPPGSEAPAAQAATSKPAATSAAAAPTTQPTPTEPQPTEVPAIQTRRPAPTPPTPTSQPAASQDWPTYRSEQAGYSVAYPPSWQATELSAAPDQYITSFGPGGGAGITVAVRPLDPAARDPVDPPVGRCTPVSVGGNSAMRCFDMISFETSTRSAGQRRQVVINIVGKRVDRAVLQRFLDSFALS